MSAYLVTREGQELGSFEISQIEAGLKNGQFKPTDWGWREGMGEWQALASLAGSAATPAPTAAAAKVSRTISSPLSAPIKNPAALANLPGHNPYSPPAGGAAAGAELSVALGAVPPVVIQELTGTKPWVRFISVIMWIGVVVMVLGIVLGLLVGLSALKHTAGLNAMGATQLVMILVFYGFMALLVIYPTKKLSGYATRIGRLAESRSFQDLASALREQRRFWKFYGILLLIYLLLVVVFVVGVLFVAPAAVHQLAPKG